MITITDLLSLAVKCCASDLHLSAGMPPMVRVGGDIQKMNFPALSERELGQLLDTIMTDSQRYIVKQNFEHDFSFTIPELARFRVHVFQQLRGIGAVFRVIPSHILTLEELGLPKIFTEIASYRHGLILVTGPTGCGKSTTLAALIDFINRNRYGHVITIEDPIEYIHESKQCLISQREVHQHTLDFKNALHAALREDPDVILIGELRNLETIRLALTAAETGHLVFGTLHTNSAAKTIHRIIDVFPAIEKAMVRTILSDALQAVISQQLIKRVNSGLIPGYEIMVCTSAIRHLIREDKIPQIYSAIQTGHNVGMRTLDQSLRELVYRHLITRHTAHSYALDKTLFSEAALAD